MHKLARALLLTISGLLVTVSVQADGIRDRLEHQQAVIERGIETGALTRREVKELRQEQRDIRRLAEDLHDAGTSRGERRRILNTRLDRIDHRLRKALRDRDERPQRDDRYRSAPSGRPHQFLDQ